MAVRSILLSIATLGLFREVASVDHVYAFQGDPYSQGPLPVTHLELTEIFYSSPAHLTVFFPTFPASYVPIVFVPGMYGLVYAGWYSDVLKQVASHGYIIIGLDLGYPAVNVSRVSSIKDDRDKVMKIIDWLMNNLNENVITLHGYPYVNASWSNLALMGHSAGGDTILRVAEYNRTLTNAIAFIEPFSLHFTKPFGYSLPTLSYGTQYSEENPKCIFPGYDSQHFYQMLQCPRILMNVTGFGHCDILDETPGWITCHDLHFCKTNKENNRTFYRSFVAGLISGFFGYFVQKNNQMLQYIISTNNIPIELEAFEHNLNC